MAGSNGQLEMEISRLSQMNVKDLGRMNGIVKRQHKSIDSRLQKLYDNYLKYYKAIDRVEELYESEYLDRCAFRDATPDDNARARREFYNALDSEGFLDDYSAKNFSEYDYESPKTEALDDIGSLIDTSRLFSLTEYAIKKIDESEKHIDATFDFMDYFIVRSGIDAAVFLIKNMVETIYSEKGCTKKPFYVKKGKVVDIYSRALNNNLVDVEFNAIFLDFAKRCEEYETDAISGDMASAFSGARQDGSLKSLITNLSQEHGGYEHFLQFKKVYQNNLTEFAKEYNALSDDMKKLVDIKTVIEKQIPSAIKKTVFDGECFRLAMGYIKGEK